MGFLEILKRKDIASPLASEDKITFVPRASATLYPDKIIIATVDTVTVGYGLGSANNISILPADANNELIGAKVLDHLNLSRTNQPIPADFKEYAKLRLKAMRLKTAKGEYLMAKNLAISLKDAQITINASINGGTTGDGRGFRFLEGAKIMVSGKISNAELGEKIRQGWDMCI